MPDDAPVRCVTKTVTVDRPAGEVYAFMADAGNWPRWAVVNVLAVEPGDEPGWWRMTTPQGPGEIRIHADSATGIVDHDFRDDSDTVWTVPARVIANGRGAEFLISILQPAGLGDDAFEHELRVIDTELATLKGVLEERRG
jgi:hypothetical protein